MPCRKRTAVRGRRARRRVARTCPPGLIGVGERSTARRRRVRRTAGSRVMDAPAQHRTRTATRAARVRSNAPQSLARPPRQGGVSCCARVDRRSRVALRLRTGLIGRCGWVRVARGDIRICSWVEAPGRHRRGDPSSGPILTPSDSPAHEQAETVKSVENRVGCSLPEPQRAAFPASGRERVSIGRRVGLAAIHVGVPRRRDGAARASGRTCGA